MLVYSTIFIPKRIVDWFYAEYGFIPEIVRLILSAVSSVCFVAVVLFIAERRMDGERRILFVAGAFLALLICLHLYFFEFTAG